MPGCQFEMSGPLRAAYAVRDAVPGRFPDCGPLPGPYAA